MRRTFCHSLHISSDQILVEVAIDTNEVCASDRREGHALRSISARNLCAIVLCEGQRVYQCVGSSADLVDVLSHSEVECYGHGWQGCCTHSLVNNTILVFKLITDDGRRITPALEALKLWQALTGTKDDGRSISVVLLCCTGSSNSRTADTILESTPA